MKNKLSLSLLSRWIFAPLLISSLIAWGVSPAYSGNNSSVDANHSTFKQATNNIPSKAASDSNPDKQEITDRIKELEAKERQNYALTLEGQRKTMDWWFSFLAVLTAVMAIFGALIPFLMARKDKEIIEQDTAQIKQLLTEVKSMKEDAASSVEKIHQHEAEAANAKQTLLTYQSGKSSSVDSEKIQEAVAVVNKDKTTENISLGLLAAAISASQAGSATKAYALWRALTEYSPDDANAQFNAGYWAQELGDKADGDEKLYWWRLSGEHYAQVLHIDPSYSEAAYNWGNALDDAACCLADKDVDAARKLWKRAGENYQLAFSIEPKDYEAIENWGRALMYEALAIGNTEESRRLIEQAEQLLLKHAEVAPILSYNLACIYAQRGDVQNCLKWLRVGHANQKLESCEHMRNDKDLDPVRNSPEFIEWLGQVCPQIGS